MIEVIKTSIGAGETKNFLINGGYFEVLECAYPIDVLLMDKQGSQRSILKSAEASYFNAPGAFEVIQITSAQAQDVRFFVGDGQAGTRRVAGVVSVVDGGKARTLAGRAFAGSVTCVAVAAQYSHVELWNPAASGKNAIVSQIQITSPLAQNVSMRAHNAALATLGGYPPSKNLGGAVSSMELRTQTAGGYLPGGSDMLTFSCQANSTVPFKFTEPVSIAPGNGLVLFVSSPANQTVSASFEFVEETI